MTAIYNEKGPQGPQGIQGIQGAQGIPGVQGIQGIQGPQGDPGIAGPNTVTTSTTTNITGIVVGNGSSISYIADNHSHWDTAYGWGNHAGLYSLLAHNHSGVYDPAGTAAGVVSAHESTFNHSTFLTGVIADSPLSGSGTSASHLVVDLSSKQNAATNLTSLSGLTFVSTAFVKMSATGTFALDTNVYLTTETSHADVLQDGDFSSQGIMLRGATPGVYSILTDNSTAWNAAVPSSRSISTTAPLTGGGDLSGNRTISIPAATSSVNGYLASTDWSIFNGKENVLTFSYPFSRATNTVSLGYNTTNLTQTANQLDTIQGISSSASPSFTGLTLSGNQIFSTAGAKIDFNGITGALEEVTVDIQGTGYTVNDVLTVVQSGASGGTVTVTSVDAGKVVAVSITTAGTGYTAPLSTANRATTGGTGTGCKMRIRKVSVDPVIIPSGISYIEGSVAINGRASIGYYAHPFIGYIGIGKNVTLSLADVFKGDEGIGITIYPSFNPSSSLTVSGYGIQGYCIIDGTNYAAGSAFFGLSFGNYFYYTALGVSGSNVLDATGVSTFGIDAYPSVVGTLNNVYGIYSTSILNTGGTTLIAVNAYAGYFSACDTAGTITVTNEYGVYIEAPTRGTNKYQLTLSGNSSGTGIWFNGVSSFSRIYAPAASSLAFDIGTTRAVTINSSGNVGIATETPLSALHIYVGGSDVSGIFVDRSTNKQCMLMNPDATVGAWIGGGTRPDGKSNYEGNCAGRIIMQGAPGAGIQFQYSNSTAEGTTRTWVTGFVLGTDTYAGRVGIGTVTPQRRLDLYTTAGGMGFGDDVTVNNERGIYWHSGSSYGIYRASGAWSGDFTQLTISWLTGIIIDPGNSGGKCYVQIPQGGINLGTAAVPPANGIKTSGNAVIGGAFGCNGASAQTAYASGGALAAYGTGINGLDSGANMSALHALVVAIRATLVANGIMS